MKAYLEAKRIETRVLFVGNILRHPGITKEKLEYIIKGIDSFFEKE